MDDTGVFDSRPCWSTQICFETHFVFINGKVYTQYDGTPIGKALSGPICDLLMGALEPDHIMKRKNKWKLDFWIGGLKMMCSACGDTPGRSLRNSESWMTTIKDRDPRFINVTFTIEVENEVDGKRGMPFCDMRLTCDYAKAKIISELYRKASNTKLYLNFRFNGPSFQKMTYCEGSCTGTALCRRLLRRMQKKRSSWAMSSSTMAWNLKGWIK